jgi:PEP-CTERM motif-containing protein
MKKFLALAAVAALSGVAHAQLATVPPLSGPGDGVFVSGADSYWAASALHQYSFAADGNLGTPNMHSPDNITGMNWSATLNSNVQANLANITANGGSIRIIFVGESAGWKNDFGYTYDGNPAGDSFTLFPNIQALSPATVAFGDHVDISLSPGDANFDLWLNAVGGDNHPAPPTQDGGVYTAFNPTNSMPFLHSGNALWAASPLWVDTSVSTLVDASGHQNVATYLLGFEDWNLDQGADRDFNDFAVALQFFAKDGTPLTPVPEPSTYGLIGALALLGLVARRRFKK